MSTACFNTKIGYITLTEEKGCLTKVSFEKCDKHEETPFIMLCFKEIEEYLNGERKVFDVPIYFNSTPFCEAVWRKLSEIEYGKTATYSEIARAIGKEKAVRAVGTACKKNPIAIIVPCHRVIGKNGSLTGFAGGLTVKEKLLKMERGEAYGAEIENRNIETFHR